MIRSLLFSVSFAAMVVGVGCAQQSQSSVSIPVVKTPAYSGEQMYRNYCAPCHGVNGRGHGPVAPALMTPPIDLTTLSKNNGGQYPAVHVISVLRFGSGSSAHGSAQMPVWGSVFAKMGVQSGARPPYESFQAQIEPVFGGLVIQRGPVNCVDF